MGQKILFAVMSSVEPPSVLEQLVDALDGRPVAIHHDATKRGPLCLARPNVWRVPQPRQTGWGDWGFVQGVLHTMGEGLKHFDFDYFQLLSPVCLPIRPIEAFEASIETSRFDANADLVRLEDDADTWMTYGPRCHVSHGTLRWRMLKRLNAAYFGTMPRMDQPGSLAVLRRSGADPEDPLTARQQLAFAVSRLLVGAGPRHPFGASLAPVVGSGWFGVRAEVCRYLIERAADPRLQQHARCIKLADETVVPTLLANSPFRIGPSNHAISLFDRQGHPRRIESDAALERLVATGRYFARKFPNDVDAPTRRRALALAGVTAQRVPSGLM